MSEEIQLDVAEAYARARKEIELAINARISPKQYGGPLDEWAFIAIVRRTDSPHFPEITKFWKKRKTAEFRLRITYETFKLAPPQGKTKLIVAALVRSLALMGEMKIEGFDIDALRRDVIEVTREHGWL